ncbi:MAG: hypothetical protein ABEN55_10915 [Bradymonadaceae bacterium]
MTESFQKGREAARQEIVAYAQQGADAGSITKLASDTINQPLEKEASSRAEQDEIKGARAEAHRFIKQASDYYGAMNVRDHQEALVDVVNGEIPERGTEAYEMGKQAAAQDMADAVNQGATRDQCLQLAFNTLDQPMAKQASQQEGDHRLGVEAFVHSFLEKNAEYDAVGGAGDNSNQAAVQIFKGAAAGALPDDHAMSDEVNNRHEEKDQASQSRTQDESQARAEQAGRETASTVNKYLQNPRRAAAKGIGKLRQGAEAYKQSVMGERGAPQQAAAIGAPLAGAGAAGYGLYRKYQNQKDEEEEKAASLGYGQYRQPQQGHQKAASQGIPTEGEVDEAVEILEQAGLIED